MIHIQAESAALHETLVGREVEVTHESVLAVLNMLADDYPEVLDESIFTGVREQVLETMVRNRDSGQDENRFMYLVVGDLVDAGVINEFEFPDDLKIPESVMIKMEDLGVFPGDQNNNDIMAYIIMHASDDHDVKKMLGGTRKYCEARGEK